MVGTAAAQDPNAYEKTFLTFSNSVELPGVTLPAGTYLFRLADSPTRNVVQVLTEDQKEMKGQWLFVPAERPDVSGETVVMFKEAKEGSTPAVQYWYYPGEKIGREFIYSKDQAMKIAARTGASVLSDDGRVTAEQAAARPTAQLESTTAASASAAEPVVANRQAPAPAAIVAENQPAPQAVGTSGADAPQVARELPRTASPLPLSGLIGVLALVGALGTRAFASARQ